MTSDTVEVTLYRTGRKMYIQRRCIIAVEPHDCYPNDTPGGKMIERAKVTLYGRICFVLDLSVTQAKDLMP